MWVWVWVLDATQRRKQVSEQASKSANKQINTHAYTTQNTHLLEVRAPRGRSGSQGPSAASAVSAVSVRRVSHWRGRWWRQNFAGFLDFPPGSSEAPPPPHCHHPARPHPEGQPRGNRCDRQSTIGPGAGAMGKGWVVLRSG